MARRGGAVKGNLFAHRTFPDHKNVFCPTDILHKRKGAQRCKSSRSDYRKPYTARLPGHLIPFEAGTCPLELPRPDARRRFYPAQAFPKAEAHRNCGAPLSASVIFGVETSYSHTANRLLYPDNVPLFSGLGRWNRTVRITKNTVSNPLEVLRQPPLAQQRLALRPFKELPGPVDPAGGHPQGPGSVHQVAHHQRAVRNGVGSPRPAPPPRWALHRTGRFPAHPGFPH